jgi:tetraacyldisaccharide 4'-kinase
MNSFQSIILPPLGAIYSAVTQARLTAYRRGWLSISKLAAPVISVGNLTTGGTGKTPLVEWVCRVAASGSARRVCVLTRGYGRADAKSQVVVSNGSEILAEEKASGDEPYLLASSLVGVAAVICNSDRAAAGEWALANLGSGIFVLDDGFQHLQLARDLDIVTVDATNPFGGGSLLPHGRLREASVGLARAGCVVITRCEQVENVESIKQTVRSLVGSTPILTSRMLTRGIHSLHGKSDGNESLPQPVAAFCGVGNPESFFKHLHRNGWPPIFTRTFADHHTFSQADVDQLVTDAQSRGAKALITTAKDATKLGRFAFGLPCYVLDIQISIDDEDRLIEMIRDTCRKHER